MCLYVKQDTEKYRTPLYSKDNRYIYVFIYTRTPFGRVQKKLTVVSFGDV